MKTAPFAAPVAGALALLLALTAPLPAKTPPVELPPPAGTPAGWHPRAPRAEIAPEFTVESAADGPRFHMASGATEGGNGHWACAFPVTGGKWVRFHALRKTDQLATPARSALVRIEWTGEGGRAVTSPHPVNPAYFDSATDLARPDYPRDRATDADGWTEVSDYYRVPDDATHAEVQLHLRWAPQGSVTWRDVSLAACDPPPPRKVTIAAIHSRLGGGHGAESNMIALAPLLDEAGKADADLVVLPECIDTKSNELTSEQGAADLERWTTFLGRYSKKHDCYIVAGLHEREDEVIYNVAVLLDPDGEVAGSYRKCTLPREEIQSGIQPGSECPVFETRFGKLGMMVCYDVFFPEVARALTLNGAEIIAVPVWGANPTLASARCIENHVYLVTSTYSDHDQDWMKTAIWNHEGRRIAEAKAWDEVVTAEIDLNERTYWRHLGDFQARIQRERPIIKETSAPPSP